jgi:hypothetical protein
LTRASPLIDQFHKELRTKIQKFEFSTHKLQVREGQLAIHPPFESAGIFVAQARRDTFSLKQLTFN